MKFFDKIQIVLSIGAGTSVSIYTFMLLSYYIVYFAMEEEQRKGYQTCTTMFLFLEIFFVTWFIARAVTFKMRQKEAIEEQKEY